MEAITNNVQYLKNKICEAIDKANKDTPFGNITNGNILDALLELRDTFLTNISK